LAYNLADTVGFLGNGSNSKTLINGSTSTPAPTNGKGWIEFPLKASDVAALIEGDFIPNPTTLISPPAAPSSGQVLTWDIGANGGAGAYIPKTPGSISVYSIANDNSNIGSSGTTSSDLNAGLIADGIITGTSDLNTGDSCVVTDSGNPDTSPQVGPGSYTWNGTIWLKSPTGGGATLLGELLNVSTPPTVVGGVNQGGFFVRDTSVTGETATGAYKISTAIDSGSY
jgi:hypothetical protein